MSRSTAYLVVLLACLGATCARPARDAAQPIARTNARQPSAPAPAAPPEGAPRSEFPPSPVTPLAHALKKLLLAALDGKPLPESPPQAVSADGPTLFEHVTEVPPKSRELTFVAFMFRLVFRTRDLDSTLAPVVRFADGGFGHATEPDHNFSVLVILDASGLSIAQLRFNDWDEYLPETQWLEGTHQIGRDLFARAVDGKLQQSTFGEPQRSSLGSGFYEKLQPLRPTAQDFAHARDIARLARTVSFQSYELYLVARDARNHAWSFAFNVVPSDIARLSSAPLIRVERLTP